MQTPMQGPEAAKPQREGAGAELGLLAAPVERDTGKGPETVANLTVRRRIQCLASLWWS